MAITVAKITIALPPGAYGVKVLQSETHRIDFPDAESLVAYRTDPIRIAAQPLWEACRASAVSKELTRF